MITHFLTHQRLFLDEIVKDPFICETFYLTGGTALSACYFNHRLSDDIDLFSSKPLDEPRVVQSITNVAKILHLKVEHVRIHDRLGYTIEFPTKQKLKVDIVSYPYLQVEKPEKFYNGLAIDTLADIGVNKLLTISQRTTAKDYVDLYFLLKKYTIWDLRLGVKQKFHMEIEPFYMSSLFAAVETLTELPIMKKPLILDQLKRFFIREAKKLAKPMLKA